MRNGHACPISGGSTICGKSGDSVCVRSTTRMLPATRSAANRASRASLIAFPRSACSGPWLPELGGKLALECFRIIAPARQPFLRDISRKDILRSAAQRIDDVGGKPGGRDLWRRQRLVPFIV